MPTGSFRSTHESFTPEHTRAPPFTGITAGERRDVGMGATASQRSSSGWYSQALRASSPEPTNRKVPSSRRAIETSMSGSGQGLRATQVPASMSNRTSPIADLGRTRDPGTHRPGRIARVQRPAGASGIWSRDVLHVSRPRVESAHRDDRVLVVLAQVLEQQRAVGERPSHRRPARQLDRPGRDRARAAPVRRQEQARIARHRHRQGQQPHASTLHCGMLFGWLVAIGVSGTWDVDASRSQPLTLDLPPPGLVVHYDVRDTADLGSWGAESYTRSVLEVRVEADGKGRALTSTDQMVDRVVQTDFGLADDKQLAQMPTQGPDWPGSWTRTGRSPKRARWTPRTRRVRCSRRCWPRRRSRFLRRRSARVRPGRSSRRSRSRCSSRRSARRC